MKVIYQKAIKNFGRFLNLFIPKHKNWVYVQPHVNCKSDKYDLLNPNADNSLKVIDFFINNYTGKKVKLYIEYYDFSRLELMEKYRKEHDNESVDIMYVESCWNRDDGKSFSNIIRYFRNSIMRYKCKVWICDTGWSRFWDKRNSQNVINYNYCTPFKKGYILDHKLSFNYIDFICQTSLMCAKVVSSEYEASLDKFKIIGFARNDTLFHTNKEKEIQKWLKGKELIGKKIIIYVPTYRPELVDFSGLNIFGFKDDGSLNKILNKHNAVIVTKLHPLQRKYIAKLPDGCISLEPTYDFSVYDFMEKCAVMVSDYSSIATDFVVTRRPVIYLFSDFDNYDSERGFSFDPIQTVCCGRIAYTSEEMMEVLDYALSSPSKYVSEYEKEIGMWHKYIDDNSTQRSYDLLISLLDKN